MLCLPASKSSINYEVTITSRFIAPLPQLAWQTSITGLHHRCADRRGPDWTRPARRSVTLPPPAASDAIRPSGNIDGRVGTHWPTTPSRSMASLCARHVGSGKTGKSAAAAPFKHRIIPLPRTRCERWTASKPSRAGRNGGSSVIFPCATNQAFVVAVVSRLG